MPKLKQGGVLLIAVDSSYEGLARNRTPSKIVANAESLPFHDETVDVIAASCVFEYIENPAAVVSKCYRVLKKEGALVFYTPNRRSYVAAIARITPLFFHRWIRKLQTGDSSQEADVIETFYRMNTLSDVRKYAVGFRIVSLETYIGAPCYTTFMPPPVHLIFILFHKIVQNVTYLRRTFGESIIGFLVKP